MTYRNKRLLNSARNCPYCMSCKGANDGTIVAAHSNQVRDGKGTGHKAADYRIAYVCSKCHHAMDNSKLDRYAKIELFEAAHRATIAYLFDEGIIGVLK